MFKPKINIVTKVCLIYMEKKTIFLELPGDMIARIDERNTIGDRSVFISKLIDKQLQTPISEMGVSTEIPTTMQTGELSEVAGEINLLNNRGAPLGKFNINTVEGFENLAEKIGELSDDPIVRMRARRWR